MCTPHLGASTREAQEEVAIEVVEAVVDALGGKLSSTAVNAPMVPAEVMKELQPYVTLSEGLGKGAARRVWHQPEQLQGGWRCCCLVVVLRWPGCLQPRHLSGAVGHIDAIIIRADLSYDDCFLIVKLKR